MPAGLLTLKRKHIRLVNLTRIKPEEQAKLLQGTYKIKRIEQTNLKR